MLANVFEKDKPVAELFPIKKLGDGSLAGYMRVRIGDRYIRIAIQSDPLMMRYVYQMFKQRYSPLANRRPEVGFFLTDAVEAAASAVNDAVNTAVSAANDVIDTASDAVTHAATTTWDVLTQSAKSIPDAAKSLYELGKDVVETTQDIVQKVRENPLYQTIVSVAPFIPVPPLQMLAAADKAYAAVTAAQGLVQKAVNGDMPSLNQIASVAAQAASGNPAAVQALDAIQRAQSMYYNNGVAKAGELLKLAATGNETAIKRLADLNKGAVDGNSAAKAAIGFINVALARGQITKRHTRPDGSVDMANLMRELLVTGMNQANAANTDLFAMSPGMRIPTIKTGKKAPKVARKVNL